MPRFPSPRSAAAAAVITFACLAACTDSSGGGSAPEAERTQAFDAIGADETIRFTGTEPFWGGEVAGTALTYTTPGQPGGDPIAVERFAGRGGVSFSGMLGNRSVDMMVTPGECSDGMSDRTYPLTVTLRLGSEVLLGCAWTDRQPFSGPEAP